MLAPAALPKNAAAPPDLDDQPRAAAPAAGPDVEPQDPPAAGHSTPASKGQQMLAEAKALYTSGNYPAARQLAEEAKAGKLGVDAQADELLAQIGLAEQGGALSLYESALAAMRNGDNARARALLTEVAAAGDSLDESLQARSRTCSRSCRPTTRPARPRARPSSARRARRSRTPRPWPPRSSTPRSAPRSPRPAGSRRPTPTRRSPSTSRP